MKQKSNLNKQVFVTLATACTEEALFQDKLLDAIKSVTEGSGRPLDFIQLPYTADKLIDIVAEVLGEDYEYWLYECDCDWDKYCQNTTYPDGHHPDVHDFGSMWEESLHNKEEE